MAGKKQLTVSATEEGIERANKAMIRHGYGSITSYAEVSCVGRGSITKFFNREPIKLDTFQQICEELELLWEEICEATANKIEKVQVASGTNSGFENENSNDARKVTRLDKHNNVIAELIRIGDFEFLNLALLQTILKDWGDDSITIRRIEEGSIKISISGSEQGIEKIISKINYGHIQQIQNLEVQSISKSDLKDKWEIVKEIKDGLFQGNLQGIDLSETNLSGADLRGADLILAKLRGAELILAKLRGAKMIGADLSEADLRGDEMIGADLREANLIGAVVKNAKFSNNRELNQSQKADLISRGAIFPENER